MANRTYEIVSLEGRFRIDIPETYKVTFGPANPGSKYGDGNALRIYEDAGKEKQRACFVNVQSFRDISIPVQRLVVREQGKEDWEIDSTTRKRSSSVKVERRWVPESEIEAGSNADDVPF